MVPAAACALAIALVLAPIEDACAFADAVAVEL